jgi:hypothetical protein
MAQHASVLRRQSLSPDPRLAGFLGVHKEDEEAILFLPRFAGTVKLESQGSGALSLRYPGHTFSERDTRAAFSVQALLGSVLDPSHIRLEDASGTDPSRIDALGAKTVFLFGSRSNPLTQWALADRAPTKFFELEFGDNWTIRTQDGKTFSVPDPSQLKEEEYRLHQDFGVVARFFDGRLRTSFFVLAGLGSRATEGCGYFFAQNWHDLAEKFGTQDFTVILEFPPPVEAHNFRIIATFPRL